MPQTLVNPKVTTFLPQGTTWTDINNDTEATMDPVDVGGVVDGVTMACTLHVSYTDTDIPAQVPITEIYYGVVDNNNENNETTAGPYEGMTKIQTKRDYKRVQVATGDNAGNNNYQLNIPKTWFQKDVNDASKGYNTKIFLQARIGQGTVTVPTGEGNSTILSSTTSTVESETTKYSGLIGEVGAPTPKAAYLVHADSLKFKDGKIYDATGNTSNKGVVCVERSHIGEQEFQVHGTEKIDADISVKWEYAPSLAPSAGYLTGDMSLTGDGVPTNADHGVWKGEMQRKLTFDEINAVTVQTDRKLRFTASFADPNQPHNDLFAAGRADKTIKFIKTRDVELYPFKDVDSNMYSDTDFVPEIERPLTVDTAPVCVCTFSDTLIESLESQSGWTFKNFELKVYPAGGLAEADLRGAPPAKEGCVVVRTVPASSSASNASDSKKEGTDNSGELEYNADPGIYHCTYTANFELKKMPTTCVQLYTSASPQ